MAGPGAAPAARPLAIEASSEATRACVAWALAQAGVERVTATTPPWHLASIRVLENAGLVRVGIEEHDALGEVLRFETHRPDDSSRGVL